MRTSQLRYRFIVLSLVSICMLTFTGLVQGQMNFNLVMHDVFIEPVAGQYANQVNVYVSVLDEAGLPIRDLKADNFSLLEDSRPMDFNLESLRNSEVNLVLVVDVSGSMAGPGIQKARQALQFFVERLTPADRIALVSFSNEVKVLSDFTSDFAAFNRQVATLEAVPNGGTCLYDAIFKSVQLSSVLPQGRRAVMVLTDGRDELPGGKICSSTKVDDSIHLASGNIRTPIYSVGIGKDVDENGLQRLALLTGGSYLKSSDFNKLDSIIETMQAQLKEQYILTYVSKSPPGDHTLTVRAVIGSTKDEDTYTIRLAEPPPVIAIAAPKADSLIDDTLEVKLDITGQQGAVSLVQYLIDGQTVGETNTPPFDIILEPKDLPDSGRMLSAKAFDSQGNLLSEDTIAVNIQLPVVDPTTAPAEPEPTAAVGETGIPEPTKSGFPLGIVAGISAALVFVLALAFFVLKPFGRKPQRVEEPTGSDVTFDSALGPTGYGSSTLAVLTVIQSDEPSRLNERIPITQPVTHIGRSSSNEVVFAKDHPVSRNHAVIELKDGQFQLSEALTGDESGMKAPTFGTFVNEEKLYGAPMMIRSGDEIRLGSRLRLKFEIVQQPAGAYNVSQDGVTMDGFA